MVVPIAAPENGTTSFLDLLTYVNSTTNVSGTGGIFGIGIILAVFMGVFLLTKAFYLIEVLFPRQ